MTRVDYIVNMLTTVLTQFSFSPRPIDRQATGLGSYCFWSRE